MKKVIFNRIFEESPNEIFSSKFDHESKMFAVGLGDGRVKIFDTATTSVIHTCPSGGKLGELPCTTLSWKPTKTSESPILISGNADGSLTQIQASTGKRLDQIIEKTNQILTVEYNCTGQHFASAGKDYKVAQTFKQEFDCFSFENR